MKALLLILVLIFLALQYRLWVGEGSIAHVARLKSEISRQQEENQRLKQQNEHLNAQVEALREGYDAIEAKAREELGLIGKDETFFLILENTKDESDTP